MTSKLLSIPLAALSACRVVLHAAATDVHSRVRNRFVRKRAWSWYEVDRQVRRELYERPLYGRKDPPAFPRG